MEKLAPWAKEITDLLGLQIYVPGRSDRELTGVYCGDLLSDVLANARTGQLWVTIQRHANVVAVASLIGLAGIIITGNREPLAETIYAAEREKVFLAVTSLTNYQTAGKLYVYLGQQ